MERVNVNFHKSAGSVKPMHAVDNGPVYKFKEDQRITNLKAFTEAGIPYARNHDASFYSTYGGEHTVDVRAIFPDFDADPYDAASYDFVWTDEYLRVMTFAGIKPFYRLGSKIEHGVKKYGTLPPTDFQKWAVICEHIIRHYNEGWAEGFHYDIEYWEIWNEPELDPDDAEDKRTWGGTTEQFYEFFNVALTHLKTQFPHLKIGGPALAHRKRDWLEGLVKNLTVKPDFISWHKYASDAEYVIQLAADMRTMLDELGLEGAESILDEWNYVKGWTEDIWLYSLKSIKGLKGAAFTAAVMCGCQYQPLDMLMYYDARPCGMNGLFNTDFVCENLKGYYPFRMFGNLYRLGEAVPVERTVGSGIFLAAAKDGDGKGAIMVTHFDDNDDAAEKEVRIRLAGLDGDKKAEIYVLDQNRDMELTETRTVSDEFCINMPLFTTVLIKLS